jgi:hypothetical protein
MDLDPAVIGTPAQVDVFSATGDQVGTAVFTGNRIDLRFGSDTGGIGRIPRAPMLVVNVPVLAGGSTATSVNFPSAQAPYGNQCTDAFGYQYTVSATSAPFQAGSALAIDSVTPGGGLLPSATKVQIAGTGFAPSATVQIDGVPLASVAFVAAQEIDVTVATPADLTGRRVVVTNPDGSSADFYPALTGKETCSGCNYSGAVQPILPQQTYSYVDLGTTNGPGFAIQNPTLEQVNFEIDYSATLHTPSHSAAGTVEPGETFLSLPIPQEDTGFIWLRSDAPIRVMILSPSVPDSDDQVGLAVTWDGPNPSCNGAYQFPLPSPPCWLGAAGAAPLVSHATVTWNHALSFTASATTDAGQWLTMAVASNQACFRYSSTPCGSPITLTADPSVPAGDYHATVTITGDDPTLLPASFSFVFRVAPSAISIVAPGYLWFSVTDSVYSRGPAPITVNSPSVGTPFSVNIREEGGWLSVTPIEGVTPAVLGVYVNPSPSQTAGIGYIDISGPSNTVSEPVNMIVPNPPQPATYALTSEPSSLAFWAKAGGVVPGPQVAAVNASLDTVTAQADQGLGWLSAQSIAPGPSNGGYPNISVSVDPAGLATGVYRGTVTFSSPTANLLPGQLPVTLVVWADAPTVSMSPNELVVSAPSGS